MFECRGDIDIKDAYREVGRYDSMDLGRLHGWTTAWMQEVERLRTNIGHIRVKTSGTSFPDKVE